MTDLGDASPLAPPRSRPLRSLPRTVLGLLLLAMAAGQASDMGGFADALAGYQVLPSVLLTPAAWLLAGTEAVAGGALLARRRCAGNLAVLVTVAWSALAVQAFARGLVVDNCGCFGVHLSQTLNWTVLIQDAEFLALAAWVRRRERRATADAVTPGPACSGLRPTSLVGAAEGNS